MPQGTHALPLHCPRCSAFVGQETSSVMWVHPPAGELLCVASGVNVVTCKACGEKWEWRAGQTKFS